MNCIVLSALVLITLGTAATAQSPAPAVPVPLTKQEMQVIESMCNAAYWAQRQQFEGVCDYFKNKFEAAEAAAKPIEKPATEKKE